MGKHSEKRRCKNDENTIGKLNLRSHDVKTMKIFWENLF